MKKVLALTLAMVLAFSLLTACGGGGGGLPNGTYTVSAVTIPGVGRVNASGSAAAAYLSYSIIIKGNVFTQKISGTEVSVKYTYKDGKLSFKGVDDTGFSLDIEYKDGVLYWDLGGGIVIELSVGDNSAGEEVIDPQGMKPADFGYTMKYEVAGRYPTLPRQESNPPFWFYIKNDGNLYAKWEANKQVEGGTVYYATGTENLVARNVKALYDIRQGNPMGGYVIFLDNDDNLMHMNYYRPESVTVDRQTTDYTFTTEPPEVVLPNVADVRMNSGSLQTDGVILCKDGSVYYWHVQHSGMGVGNKPETKLLSKIANDGARLLPFSEGQEITYVLSQDGDLFTYERDSFENKYVKKPVLTEAKVLAWDSNPGFWQKTMSGGYAVFQGTSSSAGSGMFPTQADRYKIESLLLWYPDSEVYSIMRYNGSYGSSNISDDKIASTLKNYATWNDFNAEFGGTGGFSRLSLQRDENNTFYYDGQEIAQNVKSFGGMTTNETKYLCYLTFDGDFYIQTGDDLTFEKRRENVCEAFIDGWRDTLVFLFNDGTLVNNNGDVFAMDLKLPAN